MSRAATRLGGRSAGRSGETAGRWRLRREHRPPGAAILRAPTGAGAGIPGGRVADLGVGLVAAIVAAVVGAVVAAVVAGAPLPGGSVEATGRSERGRA